ncbi:MAG: hypothetical protein IH991_00510 [Planctomycetes bacterium]|nr:hypothetical protein [Planctomycetota bacterium]
MNQSESDAPEYPSRNDAHGFAEKGDLKAELRLAETVYGLRFRHCAVGEIHIGPSCPSSFMLDVLCKSLLFRELRFAGCISWTRAN